MSRPSQHDLSRLLESLAEGAPRERSVVAENQRRERIASAIDERLERLSSERARKRRRVFAAGIAAAFATGAAAAWVVVRPPSVPGADIVATVTSDRPVQLRHHGESRTATSLRIEASDELHTGADATTTAILANGAAVDVAPGSDLRFDAHVDSGERAGEDLRLGQGKVWLRVPKLGPHHTLSVVTPDARVTVRGTRFSVAVLGAAGAVETRVQVTEGSVWVDQAGHEDVLSAGQSWTSRPTIAGVATAEATAPAPARPGSAMNDPVAANDQVAEKSGAPDGTAASQETTTADESERKASASAARSRAGHRSGEARTSAAPSRSASVAQTEKDAPAPSAAAAAPSSATDPSAKGASPAVASRDEVGESTLAAENELYWRAAASVRGGDDAHAVGLLESFLSRFPGSPLAQNAQVEHLRALVRLGRHAAAARAAERYLSVYPHGFASEEARRLLAPAGPSTAP